MANGAAPAILPVPRWLRNRVNLWAKRLNLEWEINLVFASKFAAKRANEEHAALTSWARGYHSAKVEFSASYYDRSTPHAMDLVIVHELYHLFAAREDDAMESMVGTEGIVYKTYTKEQERIAEAFAHALVQAYKRKRG